MDNKQLSLNLKKAIEAALLGANEINKIYSTDFKVITKADYTPVTLADKLANEVIEAHLLSSNIKVLGEEGIEIPYEERRNELYLWIVDPLDGTKEFVKRNGEFTVNIGLVENGKPIIGVIYSPVFKDLYFAAKGVGAFKLNRHKHIELGYISDLSIEELIRYSERLPIFKQNYEYTIVASRSHLSKELNSYIEQLKREKKKIKLINTGSSIKMCLVAEGIADVYPRHGTTMEWDTCAGQCIVEESGGRFLNLHTKESLLYNKEDLKNPDFICLQP
jgi:3'(2'), 5'-bisphosphate nucleotidase